MARKRKRGSCAQERALRSEPVLCSLYKPDDKYRAKTLIRGLTELDQRDNDNANRIDVLVMEIGRPLNLLRTGAWSALNSLALTVFPYIIVQPILIPVSV